MADAFMVKLGSIFNTNGFGKQFVVMSATDPLYGTVTANFGPDNDGVNRIWPSLQSLVTASVTATSVNGGGLVPYRGDQVFLAPGFTDESVVIPHVLGGFTITGLGNLGDAAIAPTGVAAKALVNNADDVTLVNVDLAGDDTATTAVSSTGSRFVLINCKLESNGGTSCLSIGPGSVAQVNAGTAGNCGDVKLIDCEFAYAVNGIQLVASDYGVPTQVSIVRPRIHNISGTELLGVPGAFGIGSVRNLEVSEGIFENMEDGTKPSDFINVNTGFDTGIITKNSFALATNAAADLKVGAKILWVVNQTEAGNSTARPA